MNTAHGYAILGGGFKWVTNLKETKEAKCKLSYTSLPLFSSG